MNINNKTGHLPVLTALCLALLGMSVAPSSSAEVINQTHWLVKSGDTVYSIARKAFPRDAKLQAEFRQQLIKLNSKVFNNNGNLMSVGDKLKMPSLAVKQATPKAPAHVPTKIVRPKPAKPRPLARPKVQQIAQVATPDPADVVGKVVINQGKLEAINRGAVRQLYRNSKIMVGDTIKTAAHTHAQIRFRDGALISLRPNTEFHIAEFNYNGSEDGTEQGIFELIKGGFRTITGAIGHRNKQNYRVKTSVATIGIRGTHYGLMLCDASSCQNEAQPMTDGLYGGVVDGAVVATNDSGEVIFNNDQYFHIAATDAVPVETLAPPPVFHGAADALQTTPESNQLPDEEQLVAQTNGSLPMVPLGVDISPPPVLAIADLQTVQLAPEPPKAVLVPSSVGSHPFGVNWGRWQGDLVQMTNGVVAQRSENVHFMQSDKVTTPTQRADITGTFTYTTVTDAGSLPTDHLGNVGTSVASVIMDADFNTDHITRYTVSATVDGNTYIAQLDGAQPVAFANMNDGFILDDPSVLACQGGSAACIGEANVKFIGNNAEGAITSYSINEPDASGVGVSGTTLLTQPIPDGIE